eukprot:5211991-Amphidinium_carterae.1
MHHRPATLLEEESFVAMKRLLEVGLVEVNQQNSAHHQHGKAALPLDLHAMWPITSVCST